MDKPKKILVVEDEQDMLQMLVLRLQSAGYEIVTATNGQEGLKMVSQEAPDLIISDVLMPVMDGFTFYKELKKSKATADIPVLILTARGQMEDSFKVVGVDDFVAKPFQGEDLLAKVETLLHRSRSTVGGQSSKKILLAGMDKNAINTMILLLKKEGHEAIFSLSGPDVIAQAVKFSPDIIIMDIQMSDMPSHEVVKVLQKMPQTADKPIVVYNYYTTDDLGSASVREKVLSIDAAREACKEAEVTADIGRFNENTFIKSIDKYLRKATEDKKKNK